MDIDKGILVNLVLGIHMILMGLALIRLFRLKSSTVGLVIISLIVMMIPVLGPSALIAYYSRLYDRKQKEIAKPNSVRNQNKKR